MRNKAILPTFMTMIILFTIFYLMGSFVQNSFNIGNWTYEARGIVGCVGGLCSVVLGIFVGASIEQQIK